MINTVNIVLRILTLLVELRLFHIIITHFSAECETSKEKFYITYIAAAIGMFAVNQLDNISLNVFFAYMGCIIIGIILYRCSLAESFLWTTLYAAINLVSELGSMLLIFLTLHDGMVNSGLYLIGNGYTLSLKGTICIFLEILLRRLKRERYGKRASIILLILGMFLLLENLLIFIMLEKNVELTMFQTSRVFVTILLFCFFILLGIMNYLWMYINEIQEVHRENDYLNMKNKMQEEHYTMVEEINMKNQRFVHNIHHHLDTIRELAVQQKDSEIIEVVNQVLKDSIERTPQLFCADPIPNALISDKANQCSTKGLHFEADIEPRVKLSRIQPFDFITIVGNLLDNAMEAAINTADKNISLRIMPSDQADFIIIRISNSYSHKIKRKGLQLLTTKQNKEYHGLGLKSVEDTVKKYSGVMNITNDKNLFSVNIVLGEPNNLE